MFAAILMIPLLRLSQLLFLSWWRVLLRSLRCHGDSELSLRPTFSENPGLHIRSCVLMTVYCALFLTSDECANSYVTFSCPLHTVCFFLSDVARFPDGFFFVARRGMVEAVVVRHCGSVAVKFGHNSSRGRPSVTWLLHLATRHQL